MRRSYNSATDGRNEGSEARRLYRTICDTARYLDDCLGRAETCSDLFSPSLETQRMKLRDYCERLMLCDSSRYGRKAEELLWRKGYYDVLSTAKQLKINNKWSPLEVGYIMRHLSSGVGHYYYLIHKLEIDYKLDMCGIIDFPVLIIDEGLIKGKTSTVKRQIDASQVEWAQQCVHRCLLYLGDLNRYILDLGQPWSIGLAFRYYLQALQLNHEIGMPHNQLGTLSGSKNFCLDAAYYYMRCLTCPQPFEGAEGNLQRLFAKNAAWLDWHNKQEIPDRTSLPKSENIHCLISKMLLLLDIWFFEVSSVSDLEQFSHQTLRDLRQCLSYPKISSEDLNTPDSETETQLITDLSSYESKEPEYISDDMVFKMVVMMLVCIAKLRAAGSQKLSAAIAFMITIFSQLLTHIKQNIENSLTTLGMFSIISPSSVSCSPDPPSLKEDRPLENGTALQTEENKSAERKAERRNKRLEKLRSMRRKKKRGHDSEDSSELSETEAPNGLKFYDEDDEDDETSDLSELDHAISSDENEMNAEKAYDKDVSVTPLIKLTNGVGCNSENNGMSTTTTTTTTTRNINNEDIKILSEQNQRSDGKLSCDSGDCRKESVIDLIDFSIDDNSDSIASNSEGKEPSSSNSSLPNNQEVSKCFKNGDNSTNSETATNLPSTVNKSYYHNLEVSTIIDIITEEGLFVVIKICVDWLRGDPSIFKSCGETCRQILISLISVLNVINISVAVSKGGRDYRHLTRIRNVEEIYNKIPLPEDMEVRGLAPLKKGQEELDWNYSRNKPLSAKDEAVLRALKLVNFGHFLVSIPESGVTYSEEHKSFMVSEELPGKEKTSDQMMPKSPQGQLMHNMGRLWLREQVKDLESRERRRGASFSPYLVVDSDALIYHMYKVKHLVNSRRFIVLIPIVVVSALDELKRDNGRAREAIRWLEIQFQKGNRFLKAQRSHEHTSLPLIKYPKKKDKEAWLFFQVVECCYYFSKQAALRENQQDNTSFVTLLTGHVDDVAKDFSPVGVAKSAGIHMEHVDSFFTKWKSSSKSHG